MHLSSDDIIFWEYGFLKLNATIVYTWGLMFILAAGSKAITRKLSVGLERARWQNLLETIVLAIKKQIEEVVDSTPLHNEAAIHIGFTKRERGIEEQTPLGAGICDTGHDRGAAQVAKGEGATLGVDQAKIPCRYDLVENMPERAKHRTSTNPPRRKGFQ